MDVLLPSGFWKMNSRTGLPAGFSSGTPTVWNRKPERMGGASRVVSFNIGPPWQAAHRPVFLSHDDGFSTKKRRPRFSDSVYPSGNCGGGPPRAKRRSARELKTSV